MAPIPRKLRIPLVVLAALVASASQAGEPAGSPIAAEELAARIAGGDAPRILDVRTRAEFEAGHLPGARNVPHDTLADRLSELGLDRNEEIVVHCHSGRRAAAAEAVLRGAGFSDVRDLTGHWQGWQRAGLPTE